MTINKQTLQKLIDHYFQTNNFNNQSYLTINDLIANIVGIVRSIDSGRIILKTYYMIDMIDRMFQIQQRKRKIDAQNYLLNIFKALVLVQNLLAQGYKGDNFQLFFSKMQDKLQILKIVLSAQISHLQNKTKKRAQKLEKLKFLKQIVYQKLLTPYINYLIRRCQLLPPAFNPLSKCHYLINLLHHATKSRYNQNMSNFLGEWNKAMGKDVRSLYELMKGVINKNFCIFNQADRQTLKDQVQILHQQLYHVFYNKYFYTQITQFVPQWIQFHQDQNKSSKSIKKLQKTSCSLNITKKQQQNSLFFQQSLQIIQNLEKFIKNSEFI